MSEYLTEEEQVALIKRWLKHYGPPILIGLLLAIGITIGWSFWKNHELKQSTEAAQEYIILINAPQRQIEAQAQRLIQHYPKTAYASLAAMMLAKAAIATEEAKQEGVKKDWSVAENQLIWVTQHSPINNLKTIARLRLARLYVEDQQPEAAQATLKAIDAPDAFKDSIAQIESTIAAFTKSPSPQ